MKTTFASFILLLILTGLFAQDTDQAWYRIPKADLNKFDRQDTLRGTITPERAWWDLKFYDLAIDIDIDHRFISGSNEVYYTVLESANVLQIDLQEPMQITSVEQLGKPLHFVREGNVYFITLTSEQEVGATKLLKIEFEGEPRKALRAPWDGGFSWEEDENGNPFVATSCQELGASVWWPCKDHMYDEPDSMRVSLTVPEGLTAVANGRLTGSEIIDGKSTFHWMISNPISNYAINANIADYAHFSDIYTGEKGALDCDYYVLKKNVKKARKQFKQVHKMLEAFEYWFGPYPFYEDGYKLVEVPYLGMEHQSSVTYGNHYANGYLGRDISGTGWGLNFDFIIIHESGHEWFANNITYKDIADMWIHESFINYSEALYVEYFYGKEAGFEYVRGVRKNIANDIPIIGIYNVNQKGSKDMYDKGSNMLHTIRQLVNSDEKWRAMLRGLNETFYHKTVTTQDIEGFMISFTGLELQTVFDQYLRTTMIPTLEYYFDQGRLFYRWANSIKEFQMPVKVYLDGKEVWLKPGAGWKQMQVEDQNSGIAVDPNFYIGEMNIRPRN